MQSQICKYNQISNLIDYFQFNSLSANLLKGSNTLKPTATTDELFECIWSFCGGALKG